jgi:hypothetical protein
MSLLLKALRQAEQSHASHSQTGNGGDNAMERLALEPLPGSAAKPKREWVEPPGLDESVNSPVATREWRWPIGLVPTTALLALLIAAAYGLYFYLMTQPQSWTTPAPPVALPSAPNNKATQPAAVLPDSVRTPVQEESPSVPATSLPAKLPPRAAPRVADRRKAPASLRQTAGPAASSSATAPITVASPVQPASLLDQAYAAFQAGRLDEARALYQQRANTSASADALLGLAAVAQAKGETREAIRLYQLVLDLSPRNTVAQAALIDTLGTSDPAAAESRLKTMIAQEPSGFLYYALGNLYAEQRRWSEAELANFEAHQREPANADYAFNLAVSLDHLRQTDAAIRYYEVALRTAGPAARFDRGQAMGRIQQLKSR